MNDDYCLFFMVPTQEGTFVGVHILPSASLPSASLVRHTRNKVLTIRVGVRVAQDDSACVGVGELIGGTRGPWGAWEGVVRVVVGIVLPERDDEWMSQRCPVSRQA